MIRAAAAVAMAASITRLRKRAPCHEAFAFANAAAKTKVPPAFGGHSSMVELQIVILAVAGSSPVGHPPSPRLFRLLGGNYATVSEGTGRRSREFREGRSGSRKPSACGGLITRTLAACCCSRSDHEKLACGSNELSDGNDARRDNRYKTSPIVESFVTAHAPGDRFVGISAVVAVVAVQIRKAMPEIPEDEQKTDVVPVQDSKSHERADEKHELGDTPKSFPPVLAFQFHEDRLGILAKEAEESVIQMDAPPRHRDRVCKWKANRSSHHLSSGRSELPL